LHQTVPTAFQIGYATVRQGAAMKSILVAVSGTKSDDAVLDAAYAVARPLNAHLDFVHLPLNTIDPSALRETSLNTQDAVAKARAHVTHYCRSNKIPKVSLPAAAGQITASWISNPISTGTEGLIKVARTHDLTIVGRSAAGRSWSRSLLEALATETGRPVLIVPHDCREMTLGTAAVWWKDHAAAARALTAALPLLRAAERVILVSVPEDAGSSTDSLSELSDQLGWHGINAVVEALDRDHRSTDRILWAASLSRQANFVVMGGFSRSRIKEVLFGGCTQSVLEDGVRPVFMLH
jgi:nucleotide-binding universal stress UspA family protein